MKNLPGLRSIYASEDELRTFKLITSVSGVGSKIGIAILSEFTPEQIALIIASEDGKTLSKANGVGPKLANRIILELKDKVDKTGNAQTISVSAATEHTNSRDAIDALISLGFTRSEASLAVGKFNPDDSTEVLIREALIVLAK